MRSAIPLLLALVALAVACAHGDEVEVGEDTVGVPPRAVAGTGERAEEAVDSEATLRRADGDGDVIGYADLSGDAETLRLEVELSPPSGTTAWGGFIVRGDCASASGRIVQLSGFVADGDGFESVTVFPRAWLEAGVRYAVSVHDEDGRAAVCGELGAVIPTPSATGH